MKTDVHYLIRTFNISEYIKVSIYVLNICKVLYKVETTIKNINFTERYMMGIWFEITALVLLLSISINLQRMYLLMKKKNENLGS